MGYIFMENPSLIMTHVLYKTALILAVLKWILSWSLQFRSRSRSVFQSPDSDQIPSVSVQAIRDSLATAAFEDVKERLPCVSGTCAVCLGELAENDEVRELRNCCHVFHRECIDRWVDHDHEEDNCKTCPLCRAPLLTSAQALSWPKNEPSWAVDNLLYFFGDDLLP